MVDKLDYFIEINDIPNILLYGTNDKQEIVDNFIRKIYNEKERIECVLSINCAETNQGGIQFIRNELKFFGSSITISKHKTIILHNADKLTHDAQSALRRCIEIYSQTTRFILIVNSKKSILNPILSRFCTIFIGNQNVSINKQCHININKYISNLNSTSSIKEFIDASEKMYDNGISIFTAMNHLEKNKDIDDHYKYQLLCYIDFIRLSLHNEKLLIYIFLYYYFMRIDIEFNNILMY